MSASGPRVPGPGRELAQPAGVPGVATFDALRLAGPTALYIARDDQVYVRARSAVAGVTVALRVRFLHPRGDVATQVISVSPASDRSESIAVAPLAEGFILGAAAILAAGTARRGQVFVEAGIVRNGTTAAEIAQVFLSDYVATGDAIGWPDADPLSPLDGAGMLRSVTGTNPAAGAEVSETVPTGARWRLRGLRVQLVTSVAAANRRVHLIVDDGATVLLELAANDVQAASLTRNYNASAEGFQRAAQDNEIYVPVPEELMLLQGWRVRTVTTALDPGDNYGAPQLYVEEWLEG